MSRTVKFYFALTSTWAYVGYPAFAELAKNQNIKVEYRPLPLHDLFAATGGLPLSQRSITRQNYRLQELQRWREKRKLNFNLYPKHWPLKNGLADRIVLAALDSGADIHPLLLEYFTAIWEREEDLSDANTLVALADQAGFNGADLLQKAAAPAIEERYQANLQEAIDHGAYGSPSFILDGELFWGQDRLPELEHALTSGRAAFGIPQRP